MKDTWKNNVTTNLSSPPPPGKSMCCLCFCVAKNIKRRPVLFTITTDYSFRKPLGLPCM